MLLCFLSVNSGDSVCRETVSDRRESTAYIARVCVYVGSRPGHRSTDNHC